MGDYASGMSPEKKKEYYLAYLNGSNDYLPLPVTREERYLYELCMKGGFGGGTAKNKKFELIEEIVIEEGSEAKLIKKNEEPDGTPYSFEEVLIVFDMEVADAAASITCNVNGVSSVGMSDILGTTKKYATLRYDASKGLLDTTYQVSTTNPTWASSLRARNSDAIFVDEITSLSFQCGAAIPVGSKISIYAIRK